MTAVFQASSGRAATGQQPCTYGFGGCQRTDTRPYQCGGRWRCPDHTPARLAGQPEPDVARYCLAICYCEDPGCAADKQRPVAPITTNAIDLNAIKSGKRRSSPAVYREAQTRTRGGAA